MTRYKASKRKFKKLTNSGIKFGEIKCTFAINRTRDFYLYPDPDAAFRGGTFFTLLTPLNPPLYLFIFTGHENFMEVVEYKGKIFRVTILFMGFCSNGHNDWLPRGFEGFHDGRLSDSVLQTLYL